MDYGQTKVPEPRARVLLPDPCPIRARHDLGSDKASIRQGERGQRRRQGRKTATKLSHEESVPSTSIPDFSPIPIKTSTFPSAETARQAFAATFLRK